MHLINVTVVTVDKEYPGCIDTDDINLFVKMNKYTLIEMKNGKTYRVKESLTEIQKRIAGDPEKKTPEKKSKKVEKQ